MDNPNIDFSIKPQEIQKDEISETVKKKPVRRIFVNKNANNPEDDIEPEDDLEECDPLRHNTNPEDTERIKRLMEKANSHHNGP